MWRDCLGAGVPERKFAARHFQAPIKISMDAGIHLGRDEANLWSSNTKRSFDGCAYSAILGTNCSFFRSQLSWEV